MSIQANEEYESVDLTEDELGSGENGSHESTPIHFVDCTNPTKASSAAVTNNNSSSRVTPPKTCVYVATAAAVRYNKSNSTKKQVTKAKTILPQNSTKETARKSTTGEARHPYIPETQDLPEGEASEILETVCLDSDNEETSNPVPKQQTLSEPCSTSIYSPKQPGKVIIIKKNNKYYKIIIPHNVMPNINQSCGPVLINIPEVGPLVISTDPNVTKQNSKQHATQQLLNLDDMDQQQINPQTSVPQNIPKKIPTINPKEAALCNKKFCWTFCRGRKRDLDGFTVNDRLGFNFAERQRSRKCARILCSIVTKRKTELLMLMRNYDKFKKLINRKKQVKIVKINEIVGSMPKAPKKSERFRNYEPPKEDTTEVNTDYDCELLLTKKVVFLKENSEEVEAKKKNLTQATPSGVRQRKSKGHKAKMLKNRLKLAWTTGAFRYRLTKEKALSMVKPCYVELTRNDRVEEAYKKLCREKGLDHVQKSKVSSVVNLNCKPKIKEKTNIVSNVDNPDSSVDRSQLPSNQLRFIQNIANILRSRVIISEDQLKKEMNFLKPVLIVNERNLDVMNYSNEFSKNNIVYIVQETRNFPVGLLKNEEFISAVELGYVKLVESKLFYKYVTGDVPLSTVQGHIREHNYSFDKKYIGEV